VAHKLDVLKSKFVTLLGGGVAGITIPDIWDKYLASIGVAGGTILDRQTRDARNKNISLDKYQRGDFEEVLGPELTVAFGATWVAGGTGATTDAQGAHFVASSSTAAVEMTGITALDDNATYKVEFTVANRTQGQVRIQVYGDSTDHLGTAGPVSSNGVHTVYVHTSSTGSQTNRIRIQTNGPSSPGNTLDVTAISVKRVV
jgi:hypothetical protein